MKRAETQAEGAKPILFSAPMVRALLDGRKTQTRRVLKPQPDDLYEGQIPRQLRVSIGDRLWVREAWSHTGQGVWTIANARMVGRGGVIYRADDDKPGARWFPSIHMPREFSRLTLVVTDVRVQRLQEISEEDAQAEGAWHWAQTWDEAQVIDDGRDAFCHLWDTVNGEGTWRENPFVAAYTFTVHRCNIDALELANAEPKA